MDRRCPLDGELSDYITMDDSGYRALRVTTSKLLEFLVALLML